MLSFSYSKEQQNIFTFWEESTENLIVNASPGSGKTTVLSKLWEMKDRNILSLAFNKSIVTELVTRLSMKQDSDIKTYNALGHGICSKAFKSKLDTNKVPNIIKHSISYKWHEKDAKTNFALLLKTVNYAKSNLFNPDENDIDAMIDFYELDRYESIIEDCLKVYYASLDNTKIIDFADQILMPVYYDVKLPRYEYILVDEAQDTNLLQSMLLSKIIAISEETQHCRIAIVGDSHQAIYGFRGALADSMAALGSKFKCVSFPLTISRRCPTYVVREAKQVFNDAINASDTAITGCVHYIHGYETLDRKIKPQYRDYSEIVGENKELFLDSKAMILSRTTSALVTFAYALLKQGIPCYIKGREIGESLIKYVERSKCEYILDFVEYFNADLSQQIEIADREGKENKVMSLYDKKDIFSIFCENVKGVYIADLIKYIDEIFAVDKNVLMLSTVHKAKGLESDTVFILAKENMPFPLVSPLSWQYEQELNIKYVAVTRAKKELIYI